MDETARSGALSTPMGWIAHRSFKKARGISCEIPLAVSGPWKGGVSFISGSLKGVSGAISDLKAQAFYMLFTVVLYTKAERLSIQPRLEQLDNLFQSPAVNPVSQLSFGNLKYAGHKQIVLVQVQLDADHDILVQHLHQFNTVLFFRVLTDIIRTLYNAGNIAHMLLFSGMSFPNVLYQPRDW